MKADFMLHVQFRYNIILLNRCYRRKVVDVRFNRVADAIAAHDDLLQLQLTSGQQTERPKRCKVVLKPASFDCGVYEQLRSDTPLTTSSTDEYWQLQQEHQQQQQQQQQQQSMLLFSQGSMASILDNIAACSMMLFHQTVLYLN
jgi:hypothetical protein